MTFFIGSSKKLPIIPFEKSNPSFHTTLLSEDEKDIYGHMSLQNILYVGSDQGCGCGFRHALLDSGKSGPLVNDEEDLEGNIQKNHDRLYAHITTIMSNNSFPEFYRVAGTAI